MSPVKQGTRNSQFVVKVVNAQTVNLGKARAVIADCTRKLKGSFAMLQCDLPH